MGTKRCSLAVLVVSSVVVLTACYPTAPTGSFNEVRYPVAGSVVDDGEFLAPGSMNLAVGGVRVEVVNGPERGHFAMTQSSGRFDLGRISSGSTVRASKAGWSTDQAVISGSNSTLVFQLAEAPHSLWGTVTELSRGLHAPAGGARVEVIDGPDAGKSAITDASGSYRLEALSTQARFIIEVSKDGFKARRYTVTELVRNRQMAGMQIEQQ